MRGLPPAFQSVAFGERFGSKLGVVHRVIGGQEGDYVGKFLRIRVSLDIHRPLHRWVVFHPAVEATKYRLEYESLPYFCLFCGRLTHVCSGCELHKEGKVTEKRFGRWRTLIKDVYCIDPDGELHGKSFGLNPKKSGWKLTVPDSQIIGSVRAREDDTPIESSSGNSMEIDPTPGKVAEKSLSAAKRHRVCKTDHVGQ